MKAKKSKFISIFVPVMYSLYGDTTGAPNLECLVGFEGVAQLINSFIAAYDAIF